VAKGKKNFDGDPGGLIGDAIFGVIKPIYKEGEKVKRQQRRATRKTYYAPEPTWSQKEIVFDVLEQAIANAGSLFSARDLYYATRPLCYTDHRWPEDKELKYPYFSQTLLTEYQEWHGPISGLWRDPRGNLHEPHTGKTVPLGTREVASYRFPEYVFDKVLYVEKEGEMPKLEAAKLAERYDMAIVTGKGYPAEAVRTLFEEAEKGNDYQMFCFHDADVDGYNIARVMQEETRRMPDYSVDVVDIGLTVGDAVEMDLTSEPYYRKGGVPATLYWRLTGLERKYFSGRHGERFELNAILPDTRRVEYIERKLEENGVRGKVIPPDDKLEAMAEDIYRTKHAEWIDELLENAGIKEKVADEFLENFNLEDARKYIEDGFEKDNALSWRTALENMLTALQEEHAEALKEAVRKAVVEALRDDG
jgi:hypothetical protein